ncbi:hypothetical protein BUALT_Bualt02G0187400 [Buddleja alternifolia]|uniref:Methyltransferase small domain-containing protein n=1 Tax=Buddleja alternifolia TaxID=168488 RepID=A0AAV6Y2K0_9LAMI|nr:hypothetical protein BUALT_Bualt02G0187400 [Buddleja alternifolia]
MPQTWAGASTQIGHKVPSNGNPYDEVYNKGSAKTRNGRVVGLIETKHSLRPSKRTMNKSKAQQWHFRRKSKTVGHHKISQAKILRSESVAPPPVFRFCQGGAATDFNAAVQDPAIAIPDYNFLKRRNTPLLAFGRGGEQTHPRRVSQVFCNMIPKIAQIHLVSSHSEVYDPCDDSFALVDALLADRASLLEHRPSICMEVGCGSGYVITSLALLLGKEENDAYYIATDVNPHAVRVTRETLEAHGCHAELVNTDIASGLEKRLAGSVDVMVVNPPYVPTPEEEVGCYGIASAWAGGENGRRVIDKILPVADKLLSEKGWLYLVTLAANNPLELCLQMRKKGYASRIVLQRSTEEESLHIIKFWRDLDTLLEANECVRLNKTENGVVMESMPFIPLSIWKQGNRNIN